MIDAKHTQGPLTVTATTTLTAADGRDIASTAFSDCLDVDEDIANAARLALCWNSHDALVEVCKAVAEHFADTDAPLGAKARTALKLAGETL